MKPTTKREHGTSCYNYGTGKIGQTPKAKPTAPLPQMQRRVMPGDVQDAMKKG
jgi:hypothetical protein